MLHTSSSIRRRLGAKILALALVFGSATGITSTQEVLWTPEDAVSLQAAQASLENGDARAALLTLNELLGRYPGSVDVQRLRGHSLVELGRMEEARAALAIALANGALSADVLSALLQIDYAANRLPAALSSSRMMLLLEPENTEWAFLHGDILLQGGQYASAEVVYRALHDRGSITPELFDRLARTAYADGRRAEAASLFETAYYMGSDDGALPVSLATLWRELGDGERAQVWEQRSSSGAAAESGYQTALRLLLNGDLDAAAAVAEELTASGANGEQAQAAGLLGRIEGKRGNSAESLEHFRRAVSLGLEDANILTLLGSAASNAGRPAEAVEYLQGAWKMGVRDVATLPYLIRAALDSNQIDIADRFLVEYLERRGLDQTAERLIARRAPQAR